MSTKEGNILSDLPDFGQLTTSDEFSSIFPSNKNDQVINEDAQPSKEANGQEKWLKQKMRLLKRDMSPLKQRMRFTWVMKTNKSGGLSNDVVHSGE